MKKHKFTDEDLDALALTFENWDPSEAEYLSPEENQITRALINRNIAQEGLVRSIQQARNTGVSWAKIARLLGVTPQAVHKRYGPLMTNDAKAS
jgi:hypothetical protein